MADNKIIEATKKNLVSAWATIDDLETIIQKSNELITEIGINNNAAQSLIEIITLEQKQKQNKNNLAFIQRQNEIAANQLNIATQQYWQATEII